VVIAAGFTPSDHDPALFVHTSSRGRTLILLYVDDMLIIGDDPEYIAFVKACLCDQFMMSDLGPLSYFLGIEVESTDAGYYLSQANTFTIFLIVMVLLIVGLLLLLWNFIFI
jgi:hypothetical protein